MIAPKNDNCIPYKQPKQIPAWGIAPNTLNCSNATKKTYVSHICPVKNKARESTYCSRKAKTKFFAPVMICNMEKQNQQNKQIYERNLPEKRQTIIPDYRESYKVCQKYRDMNDRQTKKSAESLTRQIDTKCLNFTSTFTPGRGQGLDYLRNIDIETEVRGLNYKNTLCPNKRYLSQYSTRDIDFEKIKYFDLNDDQCIGR